MHKLELINGKQQDNYLINNRAVDRETYQEAILDAEKEERRHERAREYHAKIQEQEFKQQAKIALLKKLLTQVHKTITEELTKLHAYHLEPYFAFDAQTIPNHENYQQLTQLLTQAQELPSTMAAQELEELYVQLEPYQEKIKKFSINTIQNAIKQCDDTKLLKELLVLIS